MNHRFVRSAGPAAMMLAAALILSACASTGGTRVTLPQRFRLSQSQLSTFFEVRSGRIVIVKSDGNVVVTDQTGEKSIPLTDDAGASMLRDRSGSVSARYVMPLWAPDASRLALLELRMAQPTTAQVQFQGDLGVFVQAQPGSTMLEQTLRGPAGRVIEETESFGFQPGRVTIEYAGSHVSSALYTVVPNGPGPLKEVWFSEEPIEYVDWSPQGDALAVMTSDKQDESVTVVPVNGGPRRTVAQGSRMRWDWKPDGAALLLRSESDHSVRSVATGKSELKLDRASSSQYSPDGAQMVIVRVVNGETRLVLADARGEEKRELAKVRGEVRFVWSPKGDAIAYVVREDGGLSGPLRMQSIAGGEPRLMSTAPVEGFFWSPDGTHLAAFSPLDVNTIATDDQTPSAVSESSAHPMVVQTIDVAQGAAGARRILYVEPTLRFRTVLADFDRYARSMTIWSPNSRRLVTPFTVAVGSGDSTDYIAETEASGSIWPRVLGEGSLAVWSPR